MRRVSHSAEVYAHKEAGWLAGGWWKRVATGMGRIVARSVCVNMTLCCGGYVAAIVEVERGRVLTQLDQYRERLEAPANDCLRAR